MKVKVRRTGAGGAAPVAVVIDTEFIRLDALLKFAAVVQTGGGGKAAHHRRSRSAQRRTLYAAGQGRFGPAIWCLWIKTVFKVEAGRTGALMTVGEIRLSGFRNYSEFTAEFARPGSTSSSATTPRARRTSWRPSISSRRAAPSGPGATRSSSSSAGTAPRILAEAVSHGRSHTLEARAFQAEAPAILPQTASRSRRRGELSGKLRAVLFCPDDLDMIRDGAAVRRKLLDSSLCQLRPRYAAALGEFNRVVLDHKTRILREPPGKSRPYWRRCTNLTCS